MGRRSVVTEMEKIRRDARKRNETTETEECVYKAKMDPCMFAIDDAIDMITEYMKAFEKYIAENPTTKREVK